jgi:D-alanyl-D-alanine carboxypeptidase/D-alanyl-D-alanine-endopeptidase (penicillin-binding protein 4)
LPLRPRAQRSAALALSVALAVSSACGARGGPRAATPDAGALASLQRGLDALFLGPDLAHTTWGVRVESLDSGRVVYRLNDRKLLIPASSLKAVTLAAAAERLGWDFRFETRLETQAPLVDGTLAGDLFVVGDGDPSIVRNDDGVERGWSPVFDRWAETLTAAGITRIDGDLVGDDRGFDAERYGVGWAWDDFGFGYSAPIGALQYNESAVGIRMSPAATVDAPATVEVSDPDSGLSVEHEVRTGEAGSDVDIDLFRFPGTPVLHVRGSIPLGREPIVRLAAVEDPTIYFVTALGRALAAHGITVTGRARAIDRGTTSASADAGAPANPPARRVLATHRSAPLTDIGDRLMKVSQNLYAETLLKRIAPGPLRSWRSARAELDAVLDAWGLPDDERIIWDGSGLSRRNFVTPALLVGVFRRMAGDPAHATPFAATLPLGGVSGSLEDRMKGTPAAGNARAKTGSMSQVRTLSGYVTTAPGERLVYSIMANGFDVPSARIDEVTDRAVAMLAGFTGR